MSKRIPDKWLIFPIITLALILIIKLVQRANLIYYFPFDFTNDISSYMARLFFLAKYGFHQVVPNWYNDNYILLKFAAPAWYFFTLPIYYITNNVQSATYISLIIIYVLGFLFINLLSKKLSLIKKIAFFLFFYANPIAIGNFIRLGKLPELFAWTIFIPFFILMMYYKNKKLDLKSLLIVPSLCLVILSHPPITLASLIIFLGLFLIKNIKEKLLIIFYIIVSFIITSFWWVPYIIDSKKVYAGTRTDTADLIHAAMQLLADNIAAIIIPIAFLIILFFYLKNKTKKEFLFFLPITIISILFLTRLIIFIPILNKPHPDSYNLFILFIAIYLFLNTNFEYYSKTFKKIIFYSLILISIISIIISFLVIPNFTSHTLEDKETIELFNHVDGKVIIFGSKSQPKAYYAYGAIYNNLYTPSGFAVEAVSLTYLNKLKNAGAHFENRDCYNLKKNLEELKTNNIITYNDYCSFLKKCNFKEKISKTKACLYSLSPN